MHKPFGAIRIRTIEKLKIPLKTLTGDDSLSTDIVAQLVKFESLYLHPPGKRRNARAIYLITSSGDIGFWGF